MEVKVKSLDLKKVRADAAIVSIFEGTRTLGGDLAAMNEALGGTISRLIEKGEIKGKLCETTVIYSLGNLASARIAVVGLGKRQEFTKDRLRQAIAEASRNLQKKGATKIIAGIPDVSAIDIPIDGTIQAIVEGAIMGSYNFDKYKTNNNKEENRIESLQIVTLQKHSPSLIESGVTKGKAVAEAINIARDMVNEPANQMTPQIMAETAKKIAGQYKLELMVLEKDKMKEIGMGALLGVSEGSCQPPKMIILKYRGRESDDIDLGLVGKGITFDTGGISLKPPSKMEEMKTDMAGGASVIAALTALAQLKPKINVMAVVPAVENMPGGSALKPGDVVQAMNGKKIEIISTDAEGRLILADALCYVVKQGARHIVDVATLTGACTVALGKICSGGFSNDQDFMDEVKVAANTAGECIWQLPLFDEYKEQNKSDIADIKNAGGRDAGAITAAAFLAEFVGNSPWVHIDIAGTSTSEKDYGYKKKGATGVPVGTLVDLAVGIAAKLVV